MIIVHICLAASFTPGQLYQENILADINAQDGHQVTVITNCSKIVNGVVVDAVSEDIRIENGVRLIRLPFMRLLTSGISRRIQLVPNLYKHLLSLNPDVILYHGAGGAGLIAVKKYMRRSTKVRLYIDSHADFNNSARNIFSQIFQYRIFNRFLIYSISKHVEKILYITVECKEFLIALLRIPENMLEYFPLGGTLISSDQRSAMRKLVRDRLNISDDTIVFLHTGKLTFAKRTRQLLESYLHTTGNSVLLIAGSISEDYESQVAELLKSNEHIHYLGWISHTEMTDLMCASDVYIQPGSQSASLQAAVCCGLPAILHPHKSYTTIFQNNALYVSTVDEISSCIQRFVDDPELIREMSDSSTNVASKLLDYKLLAARIYN